MGSGLLTLYNLLVPDIKTGCHVWPLRLLNSYYCDRILSYILTLSPIIFSGYVFYHAYAIAANIGNDICNSTFTCQNLESMVT